MYHVRLALCYGQVLLLGLREIPDFFSFSSNCYGYCVSAIGLSSCQFQTGFPLDTEICVHPDVKGPFVQ